MGETPERFEIEIGEAVFSDLRERLTRTRWPDGPRGWELGVDLGYLRELCAHWADGYDPARLPALLNRFVNRRWQRLHFVHEGGGGGVAATAATRLARGPD